MKKIIIFATLVVVTLACSTIKKQVPIDYDLYVNQFVGTGFHGHTFLGASVPFGAIQAGPQNIVKGWDWCSGYHYSDNILIGFSHTHMNGTGISDGGDVLIMPYTGAKKLFRGTQENPETGYATKYSHDREVSKLGYYSLVLDTYDIKAELTAAERSAMHRYTFPAGADTSRIIIDLKEGSGWDRPTNTFIEINSDNLLTGYRFSDGWGNGQQLYFAIKFEKPMGDVQLYREVEPSADQMRNAVRGNSVRRRAAQGNQAVPTVPAQEPVQGNKVESKGSKALITYKENPGQVKFKLGISHVSIENAILNLDTEIPDWNFENVVAEAKSKWSRELDKIVVEDSDNTAKTVFYTALYHTMVSPNLYSDVNGDYRMSGPQPREVVKNAPHETYTMLSLWDTYRAANPLYLLTQPERVDGMINTMLNIYKQQGKLPIWHLRGHETDCMVGYSAVPIVVDAYMKGYKGFDAELAFEAVRASAMYDERGMDYIKKIGYIPYDKEGESVAKALEYCVSDWAVSQMAAKMGKTEDAEYFAKRAKYYKNYYDESVGYFRGKDEAGNWNPVFDAKKANRPWIADYTEGNAAQYLWLVSHDVEGLIELVGGDEKFNERLDQFFVDSIASERVISDITGLIGLYAHGNEPGHQTIYLYAYSGQQWKTAEKARYIMDEMYTDRPDGIIGNEDCGQMSAWYVFTSLGFYPVNTPSNAYVFGSPRFDKVTVNLANDKKLVVEAKNNSKDNIYIQKVELNGKPYDKSYITYGDFNEGGNLTFYMGPQPNYEFGANPENRPKSILYSN